MIYAKDNFGTPLEFLLDELAVDQLVLTGLAADSSVMFTAHDAFLRKYELWYRAIASRPNTMRIGVTPSRTWHAR